MSDGIDYDKLSSMIKEAVAAQFNNQSTRDNSSLIIQVITLVGVMFVPVLTHWINAKYGTTGGPTGLPGVPGQSGLGRDVDQDEMDAEELAEAQRREQENALVLQSLDDNREESRVDQADVEGV